VSILGNRVLRVEDPGFLSTGAVYTEDVQDERLAGAVYVHFVRSTVAHATIAGIDPSAALGASGVLAVYTGADLAAAGVQPAKPSMASMNQAMVNPMLATGVVRYVGEPVAAVVTEEYYQGEDAIELVDVDYDMLPAVVTMADALSGAKGYLFPAAATNVVCTYGDATAANPGLFDGCEVVVSEVLQNTRVAPAPMECRSANAVWGADGRLTAWIPNQGAQGTKAGLADRLGLDRDAVRVITPDVGGGFGAKFGVDPEAIVTCWIARALGRPARWSETRNENLVGMVHGRAQEQQVTIGGSKDGTILAYRLEITQDCGAYPRSGAFLPSLTILMAPGPYRIPRAEAWSTSVVTNTTPVGAYRGAGRPEAAAAIDRAVDLFADAAGVDPAAVRRKNLLPTFTEPHKTAFGAVYDSGDYVTALEKALAAADYDGLLAEQAARRASGDSVQLGIGLSSYVEITAQGGAAGPNENSTVEVHPDGTVTILTGTSPHGQGHQTVWAMLASEELGIPMENITVKWGDTDLVPRGGGTGGSRSLQLGGAAVRQASRELLDVARERAAATLEIAPADLSYDVESAAFTVKGDPDRSVPLSGLAEAERLYVHTVFTAPGPTFPFGSHVALVEVDIETGKVRLLRVVTVDDAGTVINPLLAEGQRHGGIAQGAAQAFLEEVVFDADGNPLTATFADYPFVSATELPSFELVSMETPTSYNPLGAKGIGEAGSIGATPAVQNAVIDAVSHLGVTHIDMPTSPQRVWRAISLAAARAGAKGA
jgi:carbon-monoxide dehydrogenase large subunit